MKNNIKLINLLTQLKKEFSIVSFKDLGEFYSSHSAIFKFFKSIYKQKYKNSDRIVFYTSHIIPQEFANHIQRAASSVDISNFFILIVSPHDISKKLHIANRLYGNSEVVISNIQTDIDSTTKLSHPGFVNIQDSFCVYPFFNIAVSPTNVMPCCVWQGNIPSESDDPLYINSVFNGNDFSVLRQQLLNNQRPESCQVCWKAENNTTKSARQIGLDRFLDTFDFGWGDVLSIKHLSLHPSNLCNFKCRICLPLSSSLIAKEINRHEGKNIVIHSHLSTDLVMHFPESLNDVEHIHLLGGEPFLWKDIKSFLTNFTNRSTSKTIKLSVNTNASVFPGSLIPLLSEFNEVEIILSLDDVNDRFEIQRGSKWSIIMQNIDKFKKLPSDIFKIKVATTINIQNVLYLNDIRNFCSLEGLPLVWWYLENPKFLCIDYLTEYAKNLVKTLYKDSNDTELRALVKRIENSCGSDGVEFISYMTKLDSRRGQSFKTVHKEIFDAMSK